MLNLLPLWDLSVEKKILISFYGAGRWEPGDQIKTVEAYNNIFIESEVISDSN
jgi:hypothetical protein